MSDGYVSLSTGQCVPSEVEAAGGICAGYPKVTFGEYGIASRQTCDATFDGGGMAHVIYTQEGPWGAYQWGENRDYPLTPCDLVPSPWALSTADGAVVAGAIVSVWLVGWAMRAARAALS